MKNTKVKAFTLVELLVSMAIIGVLLGLTLYGIGAAQRNSRDVARKAAIQDINAGIQDYYTIYGAYPETYSFDDTGALRMCENGPCTDTSSKLVKVPLDKTTKPSSSISGTDIDTGAVTSGKESTYTQYCINITTGGYELSVQLENEEVYSLGTTIDNGSCFAVTP